MPASREFSVRIKDQPGTLGTICRTLANSGVKILALQSVPSEGESLIRFTVDKPSEAKTALDAKHLAFTEAEVAHARLLSEAGELAMAASQLGEANININYAYSGIELGTNEPVVVFGVTDVRQALAVIDPCGGTAKAAIDPSGGVAKAAIDPCGGVAKATTDQSVQSAKANV